MADPEILHRRYAKALFDYSEKKKCLDEIMRDYDTMNKTAKDNPKLLTMFLHPEINKSEKESLITALSGRMGFTENFKNFLFVLNRKNRMSLLHGVFLKYRDYYEKSTKKAKIFLKSAVELEEKQVDALVKKLCGCLKEDVILDIKIDKNLIGGIYLKIRDKIYDFSVKTMLANLKIKISA